MRRARRRWWLRRIEIVFWTLAIVLLGCYAAVYLDRSLYQAYEEWSFDRKLSKEPAPVIGFVLHTLRFGSGNERSADARDAFDQLQPPPKAIVAPPIRLQPGAVIGRIEIPRVGVHAIVVESTTALALRRAVGHIEGTSLPGQRGNVGLAGHRDTFFRGLQRIRADDRIRLATLEGSYEYVVESTRVVDPGNVEVLAASGYPTLTLVTCYPFHYVGSAPRRFIVRARQVSGPAVTPDQQAAVPVVAPSPGPQVRRPHAPLRKRRPPDS